MRTRRCMHASISFTSFKKYKVNLIIWIGEMQAKGVLIDWTEKRKSSRRSCARWCGHRYWRHNICCFIFTLVIHRIFRNFRVDPPGRSSSLGYSHDLNYRYSTEYLWWNNTHFGIFGGYPTRYRYISHSVFHFSNGDCHHSCWRRRSRRSARGPGPAPAAAAPAGSPPPPSRPASRPS